MTTQQKPRVGIIGLGIMGGIMGETLLQQGFDVVGYDLVPACRARLRRAGGVVAFATANERAAIATLGRAA